jgi:aryl-alcohol dehydrogenase-like predicted oxidoreductase
MKTRPLGRTGLQVSEIGFGAWGLGRSMWLGVDDEEGERALHEALDLGINFIDTALAYGDGHSEGLIASVLESRGGRDGVVVATKIPPMGFEWPGKAESPLQTTFPAHWVRKCVEDSLRNLEAEALDLEQFHVWHDAWLAHPAWGDTRRTMEDLTREGKVLHWGVSINDHEPETALRVLEDPLMETAQAIYNIFDRSPERGLFELAERRVLGIIVRVPFDEGALTGKVRAETVFPPGDWRNRYFRGDRKAEAATRADRLADLLGDEARSLPELALRFCLSAKQVSTVIPGMRRPSHVRANVVASDGHALSDRMLGRLGEHAWEKNWYGA